MVSISRPQRSTPPSRCCAGLFIVALAVAIAGCTSTSLSTPDQTVAKCQVTLTAPQAMIAGAGGSGTVAVASAAECAWTATTDAAWITDLTPKSGQGAGSVQFTVAANPARASREADINVNGALARIRQDVGACAFTVTPPSVTVSSAGGPGSFTVTTVAGCAWTVSSQIPWITITSPTDNNGSGTVTFTAAGNTTGGTRSGSLTIAGQTVSVTQTAVGCGYSLNPPSQSIGDSGGSISVDVQTSQGCGWNAVSNAPWITVTSGASGTGPGSVGLTVAANTGGARNGTVLIAGQTFSVTQSADPCAYTVAPLNQSVGDAGGAATPIAVTTASHCTWTATSNDGWLTVASGASGTGNGTVQVNVAANSGGTRAGTLTIAGQTVTITQTAAGCSYNVSPLNPPNIGVNGGAVAQVTVTTASHCAWTAVSNNPSFLQVTSGASGTGTGQVQSTMSPNSGGSRTGTMAVAGSTVSVNQDPCNYTLGSSSVPMPIGFGGANGVTVPVTTNGTACAWTASESLSWVTLTGGASGTGSGTVTFNVDPNVASSRSGTITIAGQSFAVSQDGLICNNSLDRSGDSVGVNAGTGASIAVTTSVPVCPWTAVSNAPSWITVTSGSSGTGNGTVNWTFAGNTGAQRSGTMTIAGQTFTALQPACTYMLPVTSRNFSVLGGSDNISVNTNGTACVWTASESENWITLNSVPAPGSGALSYTVDPNLTLLPRTGLITIAGQTFTVTQD